MKVPPNKPHFFKPILPGFKNGLKIPIGFLKYLKRHDQYEHAILRRKGKKWLVKVNDRRLEKGNWKEFVEEHDLQLGDLLIFKYEGDMEFEVSIFDSSHCDREYVEYLYEDEDEDEEEEEEGTTHDDKSFGQPHFECIVRPYCLLKGFMFLPQQFAIANGLTNKKCTLIVRDERQKSWNIKLCSYGNRAYIGNGWRKFAVEKYLKDGDRIMFEIVTNGETPIWKFRVVTHGETPMRKFQGKDGWYKFMVDNCLKKRDRIMFEVVTNGETPIWKFQVVTIGGTSMHKFQDIKKKPSNPLNAQVSTSTSGGDDDHPYFVSTIKPYCISKPILYLPLGFAKSNGLMNRKCEMILKTEAQRCWSVWLGRESHHFGIMNGWTKFREENGLQANFLEKLQREWNIEAIRLKIPIGFLKYLKGYDQYEHAILRRVGKKCLVKLNEHRFEEGWEKFVEDHDVQLGDMLVFRHEGNMEFEVSIFDSTYCDREYAECTQIQEQDEDEDEDEDEVQEEGDTSINDKPNPCIMSSNRAFLDTEEVSTHFVFTVKPYCLTNGYFRLPKKFALANGFVKTCDLIIRDERQRSWNLRLTAYGSEIYIVGGWKEFRDANCLKVGDRRMFEVVTNGEKPVWKFHDKPSPNIKSSNKSFLYGEAVSPKPFGYSRFVCTVRPYCLSNDFLRIPKKFAHANGLINKKRDLIVRDERQRSWDLRLCYFGTCVCIKGGWHEFRDSNCLKEGDRIMFDVVTNGEKPIWQFNFMVRFLI
ncbi:B3 domain-containing protein REM10-like [Solanum stenotomum]|uniref:B3 domain-containing protein REM10-like n=1 Tax=Solanum stenotomum TaxID=172797 RepID=UPI0020D1A9DA|nr:B3 domain-containing protein REM10-like [Solanum stenotomum]